MILAEQLPSMLTDCTVEVGLEALVELIVELGTELGTLPEPARYQFAFGSFKHSPTVTDLNPLLYIEARMWSVRL